MNSDSSMEKELNDNLNRQTLNLEKILEVKTKLTDKLYGENYEEENIEEIVFDLVCKNGES